MHSYKTEGIILKRSNLNEADKLLTIYSKHFGKISILAKGIRKIKSKKGGNLELFNQVRICVSKGRNLDIITEVEVIDPFKGWRRNLKKIAVAYQLCELVDKLTAERAEGREIYELLTNYLKNLTEVDDYSGLINNFELSLLQLLGFWPRGKVIGSLDLESYIENLINRRLYAREFLKKV